MPNRLFLSVALMFGVLSAVAQDATFEKSRYTSPKMTKEMDVILRVTNSYVEISGKGFKQFANLVIPFSSIDSLTYERAVRHRVGEGAAVMAVSLGAGAIVMATKTKSYWLDIEYHEGAAKQLAVLRLDKSEYQRIVDILQQRTGRQITEVDAKKSALNPTAESKDVDEVLAFRQEAVAAALKTAMDAYGCKIAGEKANRIECKRSRGYSERSGGGGEMVVATLEANGDRTRVRIETDKGMLGRMAKKNWSTPIYKAMMEALQKPPETASTPPAN